jgi:hypothetical protein
MHLSLFTTLITSTALIILASTNNIASSQLQPVIGDGPDIALVRLRIQRRELRKTITRSTIPIVLTGLIQVGIHAYLPIPSTALNAIFFSFTVRQNPPILFNSHAHGEILLSIGPTAAKYHPTNPRERFRS